MGWSALLAVPWSAATCPILRERSSAGGRIEVDANSNGNYRDPLVGTGPRMQPDLSTSLVGGSPILLVVSTALERSRATAA